MTKSSCWPWVSSVALKGLAFYRQFESAAPPPGRIWGLQACLGPKGPQVVRYTEDTGCCQGH